MTSISGHTDASAARLELMAKERKSLRDHGSTKTNDKWPLWWSVIGVSAVCGTFWTALFTLIF